MTICLIVDDSATIRKAIRNILAGFQFEMDEAADGQEALDYCKMQMPDVVMLDWNMPVMTGIEFLRELRQLPNGWDPQVIFCTTENDMSRIQEGMNAGANEYIMKPFSQEIIRDKLELLGIL